MNTIKAYLLILALSLTICSEVCAQRIYSVSPEFVDGTTQFSSLQTAVDFAAEGSIIYVYPGTYNESINIGGKSVFIVGSGYGVSQNYGDLDVAIDPYIQGTVTLEGEGQVVIEGLRLKQLSIKNKTTANVRKVYIEALKVESSNVNFQSIYLSGGRITVYSVGASQRYAQIQVLGQCNLTFENSIFPDTALDARFHLLYAGGIRQPAGTGAIVFDRCYMSNQLYLNNRVMSVISNCIFSTSRGNWSAPGSGSAIVNSLFAIGGNNGSNLYGVDTEDVFVSQSDNGHAFSFDKRYQIKQNSPARGFATDGGDCGPYGGPNPYVPSGLPSIPLIYSLGVPDAGTTGGGLPVNVKVRTQN